MKTFHCFLLAIIILIFPGLNAQDITGDWYGIRPSKKADSLRINLHVYKDNNRLKAIFDFPDQDEFNIPADEITINKDIVSFQNSARSVTYKGRVSHDFSIIYGELTDDG